MGILDDAQKGVTSAYINSLDSLLSALDKQVKTADKELFDEIKSASSKIEGEALKQEYLEYMSEYISDLSLNEATLRNSFIIALYSFLEFRLGWFCGKFQEELKLEVSWKDFRGDMLGRAEKYLTKLCGKKLNSEDWKSVLLLESIRNCVVHNYGSIPNQPQFKNLLKFVKEKGMLIEQDGYDRENIVLVSSKFCEELLKSVENILYSLHVSKHIAPKKVT